MKTCLYLAVLFSLAGFLKPVKGELKKSLVTLKQDVQKLRERVTDLASRLKNAEITKLDLAERLSKAMKTIENLKSERTVKKRAFTSSQVAFYAALRHSVHAMDPHHAVVFDDVFTSTSPDVYNDVNGMFTAPVSGLYCFSWTNNVDATDYQSTELVLEGKPMAWAYADTKGDQNEDDYGSSSQTILLKVDKGQHVWIRTGAQGKGTLHGEDYTSFSGFLVYQTDDSTSTGD
ncbi:complement C1q-like protein 4 [Mytilus edulis]|uniref:complement C1q-like protein 4 n=1 Tax=Mytilus edulis TaxID=6550 RepID=UPI0039EEB275